MESSSFFLPFGNTNWNKKIGVPYSHINHKGSEASRKSRQFHFEIKGILSRYQAFTPEDWSSRDEQIHKIIERILYSIQPHDQLYLFWWSLAFHTTLRRPTGSLLGVFNPSNHTRFHPKPALTPNRLNFTLMNKAILFLMSGSLTTTNFLSDFKPFAVPPFQSNNRYPCNYRCLYIRRGSKPYYRKYTGIPEKRIMEMYWAAWSK